MNENEHTRAKEEGQRLVEELTVARELKKAGTHAQRTQEAKLEKVFRKLKADDVDKLVGERNVEFQHIADATMAWYTLLFAANIFRQEPGQKEAVMKTLSASLVVLGSLIKYAYALGIRRGSRTASGAVRTRRRKGG